MPSPTPNPDRILARCSLCGSLSLKVGPVGGRVATECLQCGRLHVPDAPSEPHGGITTNPVKGDHSDTTVLHSHPQQSISITGNPEKLALLAEVAQNLGLRVTTDTARRNRRGIF